MSDETTTITGEEAGHSADSEPSPASNGAGSRGLHTLKTDAERYVHSSGSGGVLVAPQSRIPGSLKPVDDDLRRERRIRSTLALLILAVALSVGIVVVKRAYDDRTARTTLPTVSPNTFMIPDSATDVEIGLLARRVREPPALPAGHVQYVRVTTGGDMSQVLDVAAFLKSVSATIPNELTSIFDDRFMLVFVGTEVASSSAPALILHTSSAVRATNAMSAWERELVRSLTSALNLADRNVEDVWHDEEIRNTPTRAVYSISGGLALEYGIVGQEFIVLSKDRAALATLFDRLVLPQFINK